MLPFRQEVELDSVDFNLHEQSKKNLIVSNISGLA